jgi:Na+/H+ antiporter
MVPLAAYSTGAHYPTPATDGLAMHEIELVLGLLVVVLALVTVARRLTIPYPALLVVGGLALSFVPGLPHLTLQPELVFLLFLPPLLYSAALNTSIRDFRAKLRPIALLSIGCVLATTVVVAVVAHALVEGLTWPAAFVLGAIVSPPDAVAATAVAQRLGIPRGIVTVLEGESLVNDATALVAYRAAVAAVVTGVFVPWQAGLRVVLVAVGGVAVGWLVGWAIGWLRRRLDDPPVENTISLLTGFAAYLPAEALGLSGVLAVVTTGLYLGRQGPRIVSSRTRLQNAGMWEMVNFVVQGLIFILIGLQLRGILAALSGYPTATLVGYAVLVSLVVILARIVWIIPSTYLPLYLSRLARVADPYPPWQWVGVVAWTGMRGVVSLAAALALPLETADGAPFPGRDLIIFLTFSVIFATLVVQGLSLPPLVRWLGLGADDGAEREETKARWKAARAALARLDQLVAEENAHPEVADALRARYEDRTRRYSARWEGQTDGHSEAHASIHARLSRELLGVERAAIIQLRDHGVINDEVLRRVQRDLDLEEVRLEALT